MKVRDVMNKPVFTCAPGLRLKELARMMIEDDSGVIPVAETGGKLVGIITDRDVVRAFARVGGIAATMRVDDAMTTDVLTCRDSEEIEAALEVMGSRQVRRLPVVNEAEKLCGILSMDDVILRASDSADEIPYDVVVGTLRNLCSHRLISRHTLVAS